jgi:hypothetical protein
MPWFYKYSRYNMNQASLAIVAAILVTAAAIGFLTTQSAAAQFDTSNSASQSATETGTATGGAGAAGGIGVFGSANGGAGGSASVDQGVCQQIGQSGAFGSSSNTISSSDCS